MQAGRLGKLYYLGEGCKMVQEISHFQGTITNVPNSLGSKVAFLLKRANLSQTELASRCSLGSSQNVSDLVHNKRGLSLPQAHAISLEFDIPLIFLADEKYSATEDSLNVARDDCAFSCLSEIEREIIKESRAGSGGTTEALRRILRGSRRP